MVLLFAVSLSALLFFGRDNSLIMNKYKDLSQALRISGTKILEERTSPLGMLSVVQSPTIPFRYVPGLSMVSDTEPLT